MRGIQEHRATTAVVVPAMLQRTLALGPERIAEFDTSSLRIIFCGGSQLPGVTATETLEVFGDVLYVLYGSTEVSYASITVPQDHREAPTTVGKPTIGTFVRLLDDDGNEVAAGQDGPDLRLERDGVRGLHGRPDQGGRSRASCRRATSAISTRRAASSSTAATTT